MYYLLVYDSKSFSPPFILCFLSSCSCLSARNSSYATFSLFFGCHSLYLITSSSSTASFLRRVGCLCFVSGILIPQSWHQIFVEKEFCSCEIYGYFFFVCVSCVAHAPAGLLQDPSLKTSRFMCKLSSFFLCGILSLGT